MKTATLLCAALVACATLPADAGWLPIDLDGYEHGRVLNGLDLGPAIGSADNFHSSTDLLVAFDTTMRNTEDPDLEGPSAAGGRWDRGNLRTSNIPLGNVLIVQEGGSRSQQFTDASQTIVSRPDDEGRRRGGSRVGAGEITLNFHNAINGIGFTLIDIEQTGEFNKQTGFFATFTGGGQNQTVAFADFIDSSSTFYDATVRFGDNSANLIQPITANELGLTSIDSVTFNLGGSGAIGEILYSPAAQVVPTPSAAALMAAGLFAIGVKRPRRR